MATLTFTGADASVSMGSYGSRDAATSIVVSGLPAGAIINRVTLRVTFSWTNKRPYRRQLLFSGYTYDLTGSSNPGTTDNTIVSTDGSAAGNALKSWVTGNGTYALTLSCYNNSSSDSYAAILAPTLIIEYTNPKSSFALSSASVEAGSAVTVNIRRVDASYTHRVTFSFGSRSYTLTGIATQAVYTIPLEWIDQIPNAASGACEVKVETLAGSTSLGANTAGLTVTVPASVVPSLGTITAEAVDGSWGLYIQGHSRCKITVAGYAPGLGATLASVLISGGGDSAWADTLTSSLLRTAGQIVFTVTVKDSRGRSAVGTAVIEVTAWADVTIDSRTAYRCTADGTASKQGKSLMLGVSYTITQAGKNAGSVEIYWRVYGAEDWTEIPDWPDESGVTQAALTDAVALDHRYEIRFVVRDGVSMAEQTAIITPGAVFMVWSKIKSAFGFGAYPEGEKQIALADDWALMSKGRDLTSNGHHFAEVHGNTHTEWNGTQLTHHFYSPGLMTNQPSDWGHLLHVSNDEAKSQLWFALSSGSMFHRQGSQDGWSGSQTDDSADSWKEICDEDNFASMLSSKLASALTSSMMLAAYPVGAIYISLNATSPASLFGGTWTQITDRFLVAKGSTYGTAGYAGGSREYALRACIGACNDDAGAIGYNGTGVASYQSGNAAMYTLKAYKTLTFSHWNHSTVVSHSGTSNATTTIEPPYYTVYMWRRTA